jgi:transcriptional regulator with XRE-family HTH domain
MYITFGEWLRDKRKSAGLTQEMLAQQVGMTKLQVSRLESGLQKATRDRVRPVIEALNVDTAEAAVWLQGMAASSGPSAKPLLTTARNLPGARSAGVGIGIGRQQSERSDAALTRR